MVWWGSDKPHRTTPHRIKKSHREKLCHFRARDSFITLVFVGLCTGGKNSNYASGEPDFLAGYVSERLWVLRRAWLISSVYRSKTDMNSKKVQIERNKI